MKKFFRVSILVCLSLAVMLLPLDAAPLHTVTGPELLYDSGWVECAGSQEVQSFAHDLNGVPMLYSIFVAEDDEGLNPALVPTIWHYDPSDQWYGYMPYDLSCTCLTIKLMDYLSYSSAYGSWYDADDCHIRAVIYGTGTNFSGSNPPCRP